MTINNITPLEKQIGDKIAHSMDSLGYRVVRVKFIESKTKTLQIMIDRKDGELMTVDNCEEASHVISAILDVELDTGRYHLEVSSPGIDRPLMIVEDFANHIGYEVKLTLFEMIEGVKQFKAWVTAVDGEEIALKLVDQREIKVNFSAISSAKLVLNDELLKSATRH